MTIELTTEQQQALDAEQGPLRVIDPRTEEAYVLVRMEVFERARAIFDGGFQAEDAFQAQLESAAAAGWDDCALDVYNQLDPRRQP